MNDESDFVLIGRLRRAHGVKGEVSVEPISDVAERFDALTYVLVKTDNRIDEVRVEAVRWKDRLVLLKLEGVEDRSVAEGLAGASIGVRLKDVYPLPQDTYYIFELVGSKVVRESGEEIGTVVDVLRMPANDVLAVKTGDGEVLVPATKNVVRRVESEAKIIVVDDIEGLLD